MHFFFFKGAKSAVAFFSAAKKKENPGKKRRAINSNWDFFSWYQREMMMLETRGTQNGFLKSQRPLGTRLAKRGGEKEIS